MNVIGGKRIYTDKKFDDTQYMGKQSIKFDEEEDDLEAWERKETERLIYEKLHPIRVKRKLVLPTDEEIQKEHDEWNKTHPTYYEDLRNEEDDENAYKSYIPPNYNNFVILNVKKINT